MYTCECNLCGLYPPHDFGFMSCCFQTAGLIGLQFRYFLHLFVLFFLSFFSQFFFFFFLWGWPFKYLDSRPQNTFASSYKSVFSSLLVEVTRYFRPFKSYTVSHLNPPSRKKKLLYATHAYVYLCAVTNVSHSLIHNVLIYLNM